MLTNASIPSFSSQGSLTHRVQDLMDTRFGLLSEVIHIANLDYGSQGFKACVQVKQRVFGDNYPIGEYAEGAALSPGKAADRAVGEAIERVAASIYSRDSMIFGTYAELSTTHSLLDPAQIPRYTEDERSQTEYHLFDHQSPLWWTSMRNLRDNQEIFVPAYLVYTPYKQDRDHGEYAVDHSISTGLACGDTLSDAIQTGLFEIQERDAFVLTWLMRRRTPTLQIHPDAPYLAPFKKLRNTRIVVKDITIAGCCPVAMVCFISEDPCSPRLVVSAAGRHTLQEAVLKAFEEMIGTYPYSLRLFEKRKGVPLPVAKVATLEDHVTYWGCQTDTRDIHWLLEDGVTTESSLPRPRIFYKDITPDFFREYGLFVSRTYSPDLQPLSCGSETIHLASPRLHAAFAMKYNSPLDVQRLNRLPHPFP